MARYKAEYIDGARGLSTTAADLGTTCHLALQMYVQHAVIDGTHPQTEQYLIDCYTTAYLKIMLSWDFDTPVFKDGANMMRVWHARNDFSGFEVISCEVKESFEVPYMLLEHGYLEATKQSMRLNYIADRVDNLGNGRYRVVDYKSWRGVIDSSDVKTLEQARIYALAYQIKYPDAVEIWVSIDQLRGDEVGYCFTRKENADTWRWLKQTLQRIIDTSPDRPRETLNDECGYCIRKSVCGELRKHSAGGGILDKNLDDLIKLKYELNTAIKAMGYLQEDVEKKLAADLDELDLRELDTLSFGADEVYRVSTSGNSRSEVDAQKLPDVIGDDVALEIATYSVKSVNQLKGDPRVRGKWSEVEALITKKVGKRTVRVTKKKGGEKK